MKRNLKIISTLVGFIASCLSVAFFAGCNLDSGESTVRNVEINVNGVYSGNLNGRLVQQNTGAAILNFNLIQNGDRLESVDNNGTIFRGTIGRVDTDTSEATFTLEGTTTAGQEGVIAGVISVSGTTALLTGTWAEPSLISIVSGTASVAEQDTTDNGVDPDPDPDTSSLSINGGAASVPTGSSDQVTLTASGQDGTVSWAASSGSFSPSTGPTVTYTLTTGTETVRASDTSGGSDTILVDAN